MQPTLATPPVKPRRLAFLGSPAEAVPCLRALVAAGFDVAGVVTAPQRRRGRRQRRTPTAVEEAAVEMGIAVAHDLDALRSWSIDAAVVVAHGRIIPAAVLAEVPMVNVHFSMLPRWRGAAPVERALLAGDASTGVCIMAVVEELDAGDIYACREVRIDSRATSAHLRDLLSQIGADLLVSTLREGLTEARPQVGESTYAAKLSSEDLRIDWRETAEAIDRLVRVGGAWTTVGGSRLKVIAAHPENAGETDPAPGEMHDDRVGTGSGVLVLERVQPQGRSVQGAKDWLRGAKLASATVLGASQQ